MRPRAGQLPTSAALNLNPLNALRLNVSGAQQGTLAPDPFLQWHDDNGRPLTNGVLWTGRAGTTTVLTTYADAGGTPNLEPLPLLNGRPRGLLIPIATSWKYLLGNSLDVWLATRDHIEAVPLSSVVNAESTGYVGGDLTFVDPGGAPGVVTWWPISQFNTTITTRGGSILARATFPGFVSAAAPGVVFAFTLNGANEGPRGVCTSLTINMVNMIWTVASPPAGTYTIGVSVGTSQGVTFHAPMQTQAVGVVTLREVNI